MTSLASSPAGIESAAARAARFSPAARTLAFATVSVAFFMDVLDGTIVNVAIPAIRGSLGAGDIAVQWMVAGYSTAFAILLIGGGRLGDLLGYRRMFVGGMAAFTLASALCGFAQTPTQLVLARLFQGATAACMGPQVLAIIQLLYPPAERVRMLSFFGLLGGLAAVLGPVIGGALIEADIAGLGWRTIFLINLPVGFAGIVAGTSLLPGGRSAHPLRFDLAGNALVVLLLFALVFPLVEGRQLGWPWWCWTLLLATVPIAAWLLAHLRQRMARVGSALVDPAIFRERSFGNGLLTSVIFASASSGFLLVLTMLLQVGLGLDPLAAGLAHMPLAIGVGTGVSLLGRRIVSRLGRSVIAVGAGGMILGVIGLAATVLLGWPIAATEACLFVAGLGMGTISGPLSPIALSRIDKHHAGAASGTLKTVQQLGAALGAASVGTLFFVIAGGAVQAGPTRHGFVAAAGAVAVLLLLVAALSQRFPRKLFDQT